MNRLISNTWQNLSCALAPFYKSIILSSYSNFEVENKIYISYIVTGDSNQDTILLQIDGSICDSNPCTIEPGDTSVTLRVSLTLVATVSYNDLTAVISVSVDGFPLLSLNVDLCTAITCPISGPNNYQWERTLPIPSEVPEGTYTVEITVNTPSSTTPILCAEFEVVKL